MESNYCVDNLLYDEDVLPPERSLQVLGNLHLPDTHAMALGPKPQHLYSVRFSARELWGPPASERDAVFIDLWDDHLVPA